MPDLGKFIDYVWNLKQERDQLRAALSDPEAVFVNMKRGTIAKPSLRSMIDLYGEVVNGDEAQLLEIAKLREEVDTGNHWRTLALQFDRHRMTALGHLKAVVANPNAANIHACQAFLETAPVPGHVIEQLIAADAIERILHYVVSKGDQDVLRRIVLEKRREARLEVAMAAKEVV